MSRIYADRIDVVTSPSVQHSNPIEIPPPMQYNAATDSFSYPPSAQNSPPKGMRLHEMNPDKDTPFERFCGWVGHFFDKEEEQRR